MHWHVPSLDELQNASWLLEKYLKLEMNKLRECMEGKQFTRYVDIVCKSTKFYQFSYIIPKVAPLVGNFFI